MTCYSNSKRQRWPTRLACFARQEHPHCRTGSNKHAMLGHFLTGTAAPFALSHRPAIAAAASRHHRCSGHLPGTQEDSRGKGGGLSHCRPICHEVGFYVVHVAVVDVPPAALARISR
eukprot:scaffold25665_cov135-Isochrysis_galbana.AAC.2